MLNLRESARFLLPPALRQQWHLLPLRGVLNSYPKSGRTWVRLMLSRAILRHYGHEDARSLKLIKLRGIEPRAPRLAARHGADGLIQWKVPEQVTHRAEVSPFWPTRVILLARDPRDVLVSRYFHRAKRSRDFRGSLIEYLDVEEGGLETICRFLRVWREGSEGRPGRVLFVRYEDLHADGERELRRMLDFLGLSEVSDETVAEAVAYTSFQNMRRLERSAAVGETAMMVSDKNDTDSFKTRKGKVGGFRDYFDDDVCASLSARIVAELDGTWDYR